MTNGPEGGFARSGFARSPGALLLVALAGFTIGNLAWSAGGGVSLEPAVLIAAALSRAGQIALLLLIIDRNGGFSDYGLRKPRLADLPVALAAFAALAGAAALFSLALRFSGVAPTAMPAAPLPGPAKLAAALAALAMAAATGYFEELLFRAFFLRTAEKAGLAFPLALGASSLWFALMHAYEGWAGVALAFSFALALGAAWRRTRSLHSIALAHALYNASVYCLLIFA